MKNVKPSDSLVEESPRFLKRRTVIFASIIGAVFLLIIVSLVLSLKKGTLTNQTNKPTPSSNGSSQSSGGYNSLSSSSSAQFIQPTIRSIPQVNFTAYNLQTALPTISTTLSNYQFKTSFTDSDVLSLARKLGMQGAKTKAVKDFLIVDEPTKTIHQYVRVNTKNGDFFYISAPGSSLSTPSTNYLASARDYIDKTGIFTNDIIFTNYYKDGQMPGYILVEGHRDWTSAGDPILNFAGLLNLPDGRAMSQIRLGQVSSTDPLNPNITFSLDGMAGKVRGIGFNSVIIAISQTDNKVQYVMSNLRMINSKAAFTKDQLKSGQEAFDQLKTGQNVQTLTVPTAVGVLDPAKVYPNGIAIGKVATITDVAVAYLETSGDQIQTVMTPYYIFKGISTLDSGYNVKFVQAVSALKDDSSGQKILGALSVYAVDIPTPTLPVTPTSAGGDQYGTIVGTTPSPSGNPDIPSWNGSCPVFTNQYRVSGGYIAWFDPGIGKGNRYWYFIPDDPTKTYTAQDIDAMRPYGDKLFSDLGRAICEDPAYANTEGCGSNNPVRRAMAACRRDLGTSACPSDTNTTKAGITCIYLMASSPSIYVYGADGQNFSIGPRPISKVTLLDPVYNDGWGGKWTGYLQKGVMKLNNGQITNKLYYEYSKTNEVTNMMRSSVGNEGYLVRFENLETFLKTNLFQSLKLNKQEQEDLWTEVKRETTGLNARLVRISLLPPSVLDIVLPLELYPYPDSVSRVHLYIAPARSLTTLTSPTIEPVSHKGFAIVETGVFVDKQ